jgi:hypothetical protein
MAVGERGNLDEEMRSIVIVARRRFESGRDCKHVKMAGPGHGLVRGLVGTIYYVAFIES